MSSTISAICWISLIALVWISYFQGLEGKPGLSGLGAACIFIILGLITALIHSWEGEEDDSSDLVDGLGGSS